MQKDTLCTGRQASLSLGLQHLNHSKQCAYQGQHNSQSKEEEEFGTHKSGFKTTEVKFA